MVDLIDTESVTWRKEVLKNLFNEEQVNKILTIPITSSDIKDTKIWRGDDSGEYTAKNGYRWLIQEITNPRLASTQPTILHGVYKKIWSLQIANKIKVTLLRLLKITSPLLLIYKIEDY